MAVVVYGKDHFRLEATSPTRAKDCGKIACGELGGQGHSLGLLGPVA